jgi:hypothetical protein
LAKTAEKLALALVAVTVFSAWTVFDFFMGAFYSIRLK